MELRILNAQDVRQALPMPEAIAAMREAFASLARGEAQSPQRLKPTVRSHLLGKSNYHGYAGMHKCGNIPRRRTSFSQICMQKSQYTDDFYTCDF